MKLTFFEYPKSSAEVTNTSPFKVPKSSSKTISLYVLKDLAFKDAEIGIFIIDPSNLTNVHTKLTVVLYGTSIL
jgi:hypothetical protein